MHFHFVSLMARSPWGGSEELWSKAALQLREKGHEVSASVKWWPLPMRHSRLHELSTCGIDLNLWGKPLGTIQRALKFNKKIWCKVAGLQSESNIQFNIPLCDLVVFSSTGNRFPISAVLECSERKLPYALIVHSVSESEWVRDSELDALRTIYGQATGVYFVSYSNLTVTTLQIGMSRRQFEVVHNPCAVSRAVRFEWPSRTSPHQLAFVGRLEPEHKGLDLLFRAFARERWGARDVRLNVYGEGLAQRSVYRMAEMLGLSNRVHFRGVASSVEEVWRRNELLVLPSRHEGLPLVIVEAMMCGRPCLVTNVSGNPELVTAGHSGFIAAGATVDAVDEGLEQAWKARHMWRQMGENAYRDIRVSIPENPVDQFVRKLTALAGVREEGNL
jgi:glycosyltransferase involved in cell wall biosynthesis